MSTLAQGNFCNTAGNVILFTNYDGGHLTINVNQNIANLKIGVVSYEAVSITITGTYASNVTEVRYAGYNSSNSSCGSSISTTVFSGTGSASTSITFAPSSTLSNTYGYSSIICGYSCSTTSYQGGCNTVDQVEAYWNSIFSNSSLYFHRVQYGCWSGTQNVSGGGDCCALSVPLAGTVTSTDESCFEYCDGVATIAAGGGQSPYSFLWSNNDTASTQTDLCPGTYYVTTMDANSATTIDTVVIDSALSISTSQSFDLCFGESVTVGSHTYNNTGNYIDTLEAAQGCDSIVSTNVQVSDEISLSQAFNLDECLDSNITVGTSSYSTSGTYIDTLTAANGCDSVVTTSLTIIPAFLITQQPVDDNVTVGKNANFDLQVGDTNTALQWQENAGTGFVNLSNAGQYSGVNTVKLGVANVTMAMDNFLYRCIATHLTCSDTSAEASLNVKKAAGVDQVHNHGIAIYPNPATDVLHVYLDETTSATAELKITDVLGKTLISTPLNLSSKHTTIDIQSLAAGSYILLIGNEATVSFVVSR